MNSGLILMPLVLLKPYASSVTVGRAGGEAPPPFVPFRFCTPAPSGKRGEDAKPESPSAREAVPPCPPHPPQTPDPLHPTLRRPRRPSPRRSQFTASANWPLFLFFSAFCSLSVVLFFISISVSNFGGSDRFRYSWKARRAQGLRF